MHRCVYIILSGVTVRTFFLLYENSGQNTISGEAISQANEEITEETEEIASSMSNDVSQRLGGSAEAIEWNDKEEYSDNSWGAGIPWDYVTGAGSYFGKT